MNIYELIFWISWPVAGFITILLAMIFDRDKEDVLLSGFIKYSTWGALGGWILAIFFGAVYVSIPFKRFGKIVVIKGRNTIEKEKN